MCGYECVCQHVHTCVFECGCVQSAGALKVEKKTPGLTSAAFTGDCELSILCAGDQTQILCKARMCS